MPELLHSLIASWLVWGKMRKTMARGADSRLAKLRDLVSLIYEFSRYINPETHLIVLPLYSPAFLLLHRGVGIPN